MAKNTEERKVRIIADGKNASASIKQMAAAIAIVNAELKKLPVNSQAFADKKKELNQLQGQYKQITNEVRGLDTANQRFWKGFKMLAAGVLGGQLLTGFIAKLQQIGRQALKMKLELEEAMIDVKKVTGLTDQELAKLQKNIGNINTRTSRKELMELAYDAGKLGTQGVDDITGFVRAANQIKVALGKDLGGDAIKEIGKMVSIFKLDEEFGLEQGMLKIASVINDIGMSSTAAEGFLVDFAKRMSGLSGIANLSSADIIALAGTLDSLGQSSETSSTAISKLFVQMGKDTKAFAKFAQMPLEEFRDLLQNDALGALKAVFAGVGQTAGGIEQLTATLGDMGLDGGRIVGVLGSLATNTQELSRQQDIANKAFEKGTSITDEYNLKNNSAQASVERLSKWWNKLLADNAFTRAMTNSLVAMGKFIAKNDEVIVSMQAEKTELFKLQMELNNVTLESTRRAEIIQILQDKYPDYLANINKEKVSNDELNTVIKQINSNLIQQIVLRNKQNEVAAQAEEVAEWEAKREKYEENLIKRMEKILEANKDINVEELKGLTLKERALDLLDKINKPGAANSINVAKLREDINNLGSIDSKISKGTSIFQQLADDAAEYEAKLKKIEQSIKGMALGPQIEGQGFNFAQNPKGTGSGGASTSTTPTEDPKDLVSLLQKIKDLKTSLIEDTHAREMQALADKLEAEKQGINETKALESEKVTAKKLLDEKYIQDKKALEKKHLEENTEAEFSAKVEALTEFEMTEKIYFQKRLQNNEIGQEEHAKALKDLEIQLLEEKKKIYEQYGKSVQEIDLAIATARTEINTNLAKKEALSAIAEQQYRVQLEMEGGQKRLEEQKKLLDMEMQEEINSLVLTKEQELLIEDVYQQKKDALDKEYSQRKKERMMSYAAEVGNIYSSMIQVSTNKEDAELQAFKASQDQKKAQLDNRLAKGVLSEENYKKQVAQIDEEYRKEEARIKTEQFKRQKRADQIQAGINLAMGIIRSFSVDPTGILATLIGIAGLAQIAAIESKPVPQFAKGGRTLVKGADDGKSYNARTVSSFASGGIFSSPTVGLVGEKGTELVIPNYIYSNPAMANLMGALESMIGVPQFAEGGPTSQTPVPQFGADPELKQIIQMNSAIMAKLIDKLNQPIVAKTLWDQTSFDRFQDYEEMAKQKSSI